MRTAHTIYHQTAHALFRRTCSSKNTKHDATMKTRPVHQVHSTDPNTHIWAPCGRGRACGIRSESLSSRRRRAFVAVDRHRIHSGQIIITRITLAVQRQRRWVSSCSDFLCACAFRSLRLGVVSVVSVNGNASTLG